MLFGDCYGIFLLHAVCISAQLTSTPATWKSEVVDGDNGLKIVAQTGRPPYVSAILEEMRFTVKGSFENEPAQMNCCDKTFVVTKRTTENFDHLKIESLKRGTNVCKVRTEVTTKERKENYGAIENGHFESFGDLVEEGRKHDSAQNFKEERPQQQQQPTKRPTLFRRKLPPSCVDFKSTEGIQLFTKSLLGGHANVYFRLAAQFLTQDETAYCGLSTLVMVLNALDVDPDRVWKSPWRFYHESMLDSCVPLDEIKRTGIALPQFMWLAECNKLSAELKYAESTPEFVSMFRETVKRYTASVNTIVVVNYNRQVLGQTGTGHFSPLGAYHEDSDQVLIMDVARFKYPPHWVPLSVLCDAMFTTDKATGYVMLRPRPEIRPSAGFELSKADVDADKAENVAAFKAAENSSDWRT